MSNERKFTLTLRVADADIDRQGHVNNVAFVRYVQEAAVAHWLGAARRRERPPAPRRCRDDRSLREMTKGRSEGRPFVISRARTIEQSSQRTRRPVLGARRPRWYAECIEVGWRRPSR